MVSKVHHLLTFLVCILYLHFIDMTAFPLPLGNKLLPLLLLFLRFQSIYFNGQIKNAGHRYVVAILNTTVYQLL